jgi:hypothetical protein
MSALWQWDQLFINGEMPLANEIKKQQENFSVMVRVSGLVAYESKQGFDYFVTLLLLTITSGPRVFTVKFPAKHHRSGEENVSRRGIDMTE